MVAVDAGGHGIEFRDEANGERNSREREQGRGKGQAGVGPKPDETAILIHEVSIADAIGRREQRDDSEGAQAPVGQTSARLLLKSLSSTPSAWRP